MTPLYDPAEMVKLQNMLETLREEKAALIRDRDEWRESRRVSHERAEQLKFKADAAQAKQARLESLLKVSITPCDLIRILNEQCSLFCDILEKLPLDPAVRTTIIDGMHKVRCDHLHAKGADPDGEDSL